MFFFDFSHYKMSSPLSIRTFFRKPKNCSDVDKGGQEERLKETEGQAGDNVKDS